MTTLNRAEYLKATLDALRTARDHDPDSASKILVDFMSRQPEDTDTVVDAALELGLRDAVDEACL